MEGVRWMKHYTERGWRNEGFDLRKHMCGIQT